MFSRSRFLLAVQASLLLSLLTGVAWADDFAEVSPAELSLAEIPGAPNAAAVIIFKRGRIHFMDYPKEASSRLDIEVRIKVLTPQGAEQFGEVEILHGRELRLRNFKGRTVLPDGRVVEIGEDALFESEVSRRQRVGTTRAVFPAVEPGAILDYRYTMYWNSFIDPDPWFFATNIPTLKSQVEYVIPRNLAVKPWAVEIGGVKLQSETETESRGTVIRVWADGVREVPDEPFSLPEGDLSTRFLLIPQLIQLGSTKLYLFQDWQSTAALVEPWYDELRGSKRPLKAQAIALKAGHASKRDQVAALHAYVRDEIDRRGAGGVVPAEAAGTDLGDVLKRGWGTPLAKAMILYEMLDALAIDSQIVWAADRRYGRIDIGVANPYWFTRPLVRVTLDGQEIWLDPVDKDLPAGQLSPFFEGQSAVLYDRKKPEVVPIEVTASESNRRSANLTLAVDEEGVLSGKGTLRLTGHHAWAERDVEADAEPLERWTEWLEERLTTVTIDEVVVEDDLSNNQTDIRWTMTSREEEVFGDQVSWSTAAPLGPLASPFTLGIDRRLTPVQLAWRDLDEIELNLTWPEGWMITQQPEAAGLENPAGRFEALVEVDLAARKLTYRRQIRTEGPFFNPGNPYEELRALYAAVADHDARPLLLVQGN
ncbi:MAG: DUF3857 domain-containing protein [Thermoanaerobaculia bacterium]|nr:DUF3857 domain-containing protein [Thermoanaerobaculia bacterium]